MAYSLLFIFCSQSFNFEYQKTGIKTQKIIFAFFWAYVGQSHGHIGWATPMPLAWINPTNQRTNPLIKIEALWTKNEDSRLKICLSCRKTNFAGQEVFSVFWSDIAFPIQNWDGHCGVVPKVFFKIYHMMSLMLLAPPHDFHSCQTENPYQFHESQTLPICFEDQKYLSELIYLTPFNLYFR